MDTIVGIGVLILSLGSLLYLIYYQMVNGAEDLADVYLRRALYMFYLEYQDPASRHTQGFREEQMEALVFYRTLRAKGRLGCNREFWEPIEDLLECVDVAA